MSLTPVPEMCRATLATVMPPCTCSWAPSRTVVVLLKAVLAAVLRALPFWTFRAPWATTVPSAKLKLPLWLGMGKVKVLLPPPPIGPPPP